MLSLIIDGVAGGTTAYQVADAAQSEDWLYKFGKIA